MASLTPKKIILSEINNGNQYELRDMVQPNAINEPIQASAWVQGLGTNQPNIDELDNVGTPSISIEEVEGSPRLKFKNLRGKTGAKLVSRVLQGQDENGGNIYIDTFDDGTTATFIAPAGSSGLPVVTTQDNGKFLRVVNGAWLAEQVKIAEQESI